MLLNKSINIFRYNQCPPVNTIRDKLTGIKPIIKECQSEEKPDETVEIKTEFKLGDEFQGGISGIIKQDHQHKINIDETDYYLLITANMEFFINPDHKIIILRGTSIILTVVKKMIQEVLSDGKPNIKGIHTKKDKQWEFVENILYEDSHNRIQKVTFKNDSKDKQGIKSYMLNMRTGRCAKKTGEFNETYINAHSFTCKLSLIKCDKLINETTKTPAVLSIRDNMSLSFDKDIELKQWGHFVLERCLGMCG